MRFGPGVLAGLVVLALSGCSSPPPAEAPLELPADPPVVGEQPFESSAYPRPPPGCAQVTCWAGAEPDDVYVVPTNASATALAMDVSATTAYAGTVRWKVTCRGILDEEPACLRPLASGEEPLPFHVDLPGLALPPKTVVLLELMVPGTAPVADGFTTLVYGSSRVTGTAALEWLAEADVPRPALVAQAITMDGHSGPCNLVEEYCTSWPGGSELEVKVDGSVAEVVANLTWDSTGPLDEVLELLVAPLYGTCGNTCPAPVSVRGTSPLQVALVDAAFPGGVRLRVYHSDPAAVDPTGYAFLYVGTRTPVHLEGALRYHADEVALEG
jgi:hypothetical protein